jgi:hypothetical protein
MKTLKTRLAKWAGLVMESGRRVLDGKRSTLEATGEALAMIVVAPLAFVVVVVLGL